MNENRKKEAQEDSTPVNAPPLSSTSSHASIDQSVSKKEQTQLVSDRPNDRLDVFAQQLQTEVTKPASIRVNSRRLALSFISRIEPLHPDSRVKGVWELLMFGLSLYYAFIIPLRLAVVLPNWFFWLDYLMDLMNIADCCLAATVLGEYHAGQVLLSMHSIFQRYYRARLAVDTFMVVPYDFLTFLHLVSPASDAYFLRSILRVPKLSKLWYFGHYYKRVEKTCVEFFINYTLVRVISITTTIIIIGHWAACGWMMFAHYYVKGSCISIGNSLDCQFIGTWIEQQYLSGKLPKDGGDQFSRYIRAINWAIPTLTSEIIGDIFPFNPHESLYCFIVMFGGLAINGAIIGSIVSLLSDSSIEQTRNNRDIETLREYLLSSNTPPELVQSCVGFLQYSASEEGMLTVQRDEVLSPLPHSIKLAIDQEMKTIPYLSQCPFLDFLPDELQRSISARLRTHTYCKGDKIISHGDLGHEMYFLEKGKVEVVSPDGRTVYTTLEEGSFFGETAIFFRVTRAATVRAASPFCVCLALSKEDLNQELRSLEFDEIEIFNIFRRLQVSNQRRNAAVETNLKYVRVQTHKLSKLIKQDSVKSSINTRVLRLRCMFAPESSARVVWDLLGFIFVIYYAFSVPLYIAFFLDSEVKIYTRYLLFELLISAYWVLDVVFKLKLFPFYSDMVSRKLVVEPDLIWSRYTSASEFKLDVISSLPYELLLLVSTTNPVTVFAIRSLHLLKLPQLPAYINLFENHIRSQLYFMPIKRTTFLIFRAGLAYVLLNHWMACGFFMIHRYREINSNVSYMIADKLADYDEQTGQHNICNTATRYCYARSVYFVVGTMTSVGYGDISPYTNDEIIFEQAVAIFGAYIAAIFLGCCATLQADQDSSGYRGFAKSLAKLESFARYRHLPAQLYKATTAQYKYVFGKTKALDGNSSTLLQKLSEPSKMELSLYLHQEILESVPVFREAAAPLQRRIAARLRPQVLHHHFCINFFIMTYFCILSLFV
ncbi:cyclic nucleotide-binding domain-containing protein [archaeon]|nr:MAG: cyclic nucleotide-binding domain-containing protein [archaeon]